MIRKIYLNVLNAKKQFNMSTKCRKLSSKYVWMDLEMTGLDINEHTIMEVACLISSPDLVPVHEHVNLQLNVKDEDLNKMNEWCKVHHGKSGLTDACRQSTITMQEAEDQLLKYIQTFSDVQDTLYLAGNSVYMDKLFLQKYMPNLCKSLHYRIIDVSTIKTLASHWFPLEYGSMPPKMLKHRGLDDILESINELKLYRKLIFKPA